MSTYTRTEKFTLQGDPVYAKLVKSESGRTVYYYTITKNEALPLRRGRGSLHVPSTRTVSDVTQDLTRRIEREEEFSKYDKHSRKVRARKSQEERLYHPGDGEDVATRLSLSRRRDKD